MRIVSSLIFVWIITVLVICLVHFTTTNSGGYQPPKRTKRNRSSVERNLIQMLLKRYEDFGIVGRPVNSSKVTLQVNYGLALIQIIDLYENKQVLITNCWSRYKWFDNLLRWNPKDYGNISQLRVFPDQLWVPDVKLYNFADERIQETRTARVVVKYTGDIIWVPQALFKSTCPVEITYFPFDQQLCVLEFGSWSYDQTQLNLSFWIPDTGPSTPFPYVDFNDYVNSNEWITEAQNEKNYSRENKKQIRSKYNLRRRSFIRHDGKKTTKYYPTLRYRILMRRNPSFYVSILVIPCILLSLLTLVLFWLPPESPAKMMLGMNIFVAFFILLLLLAESTPSAVKNFPLIGGYYCLNMIMITLSTFIAVTIINLYFRGEKRGPVPSLLRRIIDRREAKWGLSDIDRVQNYVNQRNANSILIEGLGRLLLVRQNIPLVDEDKLKKILAASSTSPCHHGKGRMIPNMRYNKFLNDETIHQHDNTDLNLNSDDSPLLSRHGRTNLECEVHEIKRFIRMYLNRQKDKERRNLVAMEWRTLALVLDRLFFCLYVVAITVAIIVLIPRNSPPPEYEK